VDVRLSLEESDPELLRSLEDWLRREPELRGRVRQADAQPATGEMGALSEALVVAASSGGALSVLAASLRVWFAQPKRSDVHVCVETADGQVVTATAERVARPEEFVREVLGGRAAR
jgi:hypothetical protein